MNIQYPYCPRCGTQLDSFQHEFKDGRYRFTVSYCSNCGKSYKIIYKELIEGVNDVRRTDIQEPGQ